MSHFSCFKCNYISKLVSYDFLLRITKGRGGSDSSADVGKKEKKKSKQILCNMANCQVKSSYNNNKRTKTKFY